MANRTRIFQSAIEKIPHIGMVNTSM
jgi:hypothetical protein